MAVVLASLLSLAAPPASQSQTVWTWVPDDTHCALRQDVGNKRQLEVSVSPGSDGAMMGIMDSVPGGRAWKRLKDAQLSFEPGGAVSVDGYVHPNKLPPGRRIDFSLGDDDLLKFSNASSLTFSHAEAGTVRLPVRSSAPAMAAIRACEDRKLTQWGIDPAAWRTLPVRPKPETSKEPWLSWDDYPDRQKVYKNDITVVARLDVGPDGAVQGCTVVNRPPEEFIGAACKALKRNAKFTPARDASGREIAAPYLIQVIFPTFGI